MLFIYPDAFTPRPVDLGEQWLIFPLKSDKAVLILSNQLNPSRNIEPFLPNDDGADCLITTDEEKQSKVIFHFTKISKK